MGDESKPKQVEEPKKGQREQREAGAPASIEEFQKDGETNLPDNPAYVAPESVDNTM